MAENGGQMFGMHVSNPGGDGFPAGLNTPLEYGVTEMISPKRSGAPEAALSIAMFGGSFDPVHEGHLHVARAAERAFGLERVLFVPAHRPPHKPGRVLAPDADRLQMLRLATENEPSFEPCTIELQRPGLSYTVDTLLALPEYLYGADASELDLQLYLLLGSDNLPEFPNWHRAEEILRLAQPIVVLRAEDPIPSAAWFDALPQAARERIERGILRLEPAPGRSTDLREALSRGEKPTDHLPQGVWEYIESRGLYRGKPSA